jgi:hypothetical protein
MEKSYQASFKKALPMVLWALFVLAGQNIHIGFGKATFSWVSIMLPLTFFLFPMGRSLLLSSGFYLAKPFSITLGIPTLFASLSWSASKQQKSPQDAALHLLLPLTCMLLFCISPVGSTAKAYSLFWCIPIALFCIRFSHPALSITSRALKSTFTAHALGSVIWVYLVPMTGEQWLALIPIVPLERLLITTLTTLTALSISSATWKFPRYSEKRSLERA